MSIWSWCESCRRAGRRCEPIHPRVGLPTGRPPCRRQHATECLKQSRGGLLLRRVRCALAAHMSPYLQGAVAGKVLLQPSQVPPLSPSARPSLLSSLLLCPKFELGRFIRSSVAAAFPRFADKAGARRYSLTSLTSLQKIVRLLDLPPPSSHRIQRTSSNNFRLTLN